MLTLRSFVIHGKTTRDKAKKTELLNSLLRDLEITTSNTFERAIDMVTQCLRAAQRWLLVREKGFFPTTEWIYKGRPVIIEKIHPDGSLMLRFSDGHAPKTIKKVGPITFGVIASRK